MTSSGTTTLRAARGRMPRTPRKVDAARLDPYARYRYVSSFFEASLRASMSGSEPVGDVS